MEKRHRRQQIIRIIKQSANPSEPNQADYSSALEHKQPKSIICPHCRWSCLQAEFHSHVYNTHYKKWVKEIEAVDPKKSLKCPCCASYVNARRLINHIDQVHLGGVHCGTRKMHSLYRSNASAQEEPDSSSSSYYAPPRDSRDGSKYIGFTRREYQESRFGSFPIHDDYSEESSPD